MDHRQRRAVTAPAAIAASLLLLAQPTGAAEDGPLPVLDGTYEQLAESSFGSRQAAGAWTGEEVLVVDVPTGRAATYDVSSDGWTKMSDGIEGLGSGRIQAFSPWVWTGEEFIIFDRGSGSGFAFDPGTESWRRTGQGPVTSPRLVVWADGRVIVGSGTRRVAAYDPEIDAWTKLPRAPGARRLEGLYWTGAEILAVTAPRNPGVVSVAALDLATRTWGEPTKGPLSSVFAYAGRWTGEALVFAAGIPNGSIPGHITNATFDPATDTWTTRDYDCPVTAGAGAWTGTLIIALLPSQALGSSVGHALDPSSGQCYALPESDLVEAFSPRGMRNGYATVWTGDEAILWSGRQGDSAAASGDAIAFAPTLPTDAVAAPPRVELVNPDSRSGPSGGWFVAAGEDVVGGRDDYAGAYLDRGRGLLPVFLFTGDLDSAIEQLLDRFGDDARFEVREVERTLAQLEATQQAIVDASEELEAQGVRWVEVGIDVEHNRVDVGVLDHVEKARTLLAEYGAAIHIVKQAPATTAQD